MKGLAHRPRTGGKFEHGMLGTGPHRLGLTVVVTGGEDTPAPALASRCVIVRLGALCDPVEAWLAVRRLAEEHRWRIIGDIRAEFERDLTEPREHFDPANAWEAAVLARVSDVAVCQTLIRQRQETVAA